VRKTFQARGFERVRQFDWKKTADEVERFVSDVAHRTEPGT